MLTKLALRNVFRNRRRSAITLLVIVFGAVGLILFGGYKAITFHGLRESTIRNRLGHLQIYKRGFEHAEAKKPLEYGLDDVAQLRRAIESDKRVRMTTAQITLMGLISNGDKSETFMATGVEPKEDRAMNAQRLVAGTDLPDDEPDAVIIGRGLAASMHAKPGDYLTLMSTTTSGSLNAIDVRVAGIFMSGVKEYDDRAIKMPLAGAQQLLQTTKVERLLVMLNDTDDTAAVRADLAALFAKKHWALEMKDWSQLATFYHQVVLLYNGIFGFIGMVVFGIVDLQRGQHDRDVDLRADARDRHDDGHRHDALEHLALFLARRPLHRRHRRRRRPAGRRRRLEHHQPRPLHAPAASRLHAGLPAARDAAARHPHHRLPHRRHHRHALVDPAGAQSVAAEDRRCAGAHLSDAFEP